MTMVETVTGGRGDPSGVAYVLETLYRRQQGLEEDNWVTKEMTALLKKKLSKVAAPFLTLAEYKPVGSTAEKLSVSRKDDKDLLLVLGPPYSPAYFKSEYDAHGRHFLKWNNKKCQGTKPRYVGNGNYLSATALRTFINGCLQTAVKDERVGSLRVGKVEVWKQAVRVHLKQEGGGRQTFIVDIIPQIKGDQWRRVAGVEPLESLAPALQKAIQGVEAAGEASVMFSLFGPPGTPPHTLTTCYALLEREFFLKNEGFY
ncbi:hypothetical protein GWK47_003284 [Chionoecetes opilio]|uniref:Uncharacterized protein n=1 Tax=Chionoecetes opilio TaxID=41210 RepID=A0A8J4YM20_CHIOP|nr:hypothetical protein GWK47_003284 [Chionoecetes opilio]KAG0730343.1 hypothetical protein GWK47_003284 [Chionoecetes opilio]